MAFTFSEASSLPDFIMTFSLCVGASPVFLVCV